MVIVSAYEKYDNTPGLIVPGPTTRGYCTTSLFESDGESGGEISVVFSDSPVRFPRLGVFDRFPEFRWRNPKRGRKFLRQILSQIEKGKVSIRTILNCALSYLRVSPDCIRPVELPNARCSAK